MLISPAVVKTIANDELRVTNRLSKVSYNRKFHSWFGLSPKVAARLWNTLVLQQKLPRGGLVKHLLWTLSFLKLYESEQVYTTTFSVTGNTFRKWVWKFLSKIYTIDLVSTSFSPQILLVMLSHIFFY
jgi:hypothetical protein